MNEQHDKGYYEQRGYVRHMIILPDSYKAKLKKLAKSYMISQGEVIEVFLDQSNLSTLDEDFKNKRQSKVGDKSSKAELLRKMKDLTPEQLAEIQKIVNG
jgi:hypothetical protein